MEDGKITNKEYAFYKNKKSYMKINLKIFVYDFFAFVNKNKITGKLNIELF